MSRCVECKYAMHDQFKGYPGRWMCFHPYRNEIDNKGEFTYPGNFQPNILICETASEDYDHPRAQTETLKHASTPCWCYFDVVERSQKEQPGFDPDKQRAVLWPEKMGRDVNHWPYVCDEDELEERCAECGIEKEIHRLTEK